MGKFSSKLKGAALEVDFLTFIENQKVVLLDGAIGTELDKRGLMGRGSVNLDAPDAVLEIQKQYVQSGCHALTTNTLTMNRIYIKTHNLGVSIEQVNRAGAEIARKAAGDNCYVLGNLSSTGQLLEPYGDRTESEFEDTYTEQATILTEAGVDAFIIETMIDLREALCALRACKKLAGLPVIVSIAFATEQKGGRTVMGNTAQDCAKQLEDTGADIVGANCGELDPYQMASIVSLLRSATKLPILAQPNAGKPRLEAEKTIFDMEPDDFAQGISVCINAGAKIVGGCCGTTPDHIRAVRRLLDQGC